MRTDGLTPIGISFESGWRPLPVLHVRYKNSNENSPCFHFNVAEMTEVCALAESYEVCIIPTLRNSLANDHLWSCAFEGKIKHLTQFWENVLEPRILMRKMAEKKEP